MTCLCMIIIVHVMMESYFMCITDNHIYVFYCVYSVVCVLHVNVRDQLQFHVFFIQSNNF